MLMFKSSPSTNPQLPNRLQTPFLIGHQFFVLDYFLMLTTPYSIPMKMLNNWICQMSAVNVETHPRISGTGTSSPVSFNETYG